MKRIKVVFMFVVAALLLVTITQIPLIASYLDKQRLLQRVEVEKVAEGVKNFQKSKLNTSEKIKLLYDYNNGNRLGEDIVLISQQQQSESNFKDSEIKEKIKIQIEKLQSLNIFPDFDLDDYAMYKSVIKTYSKATDPEYCVSVFEVVLSSDDEVVEILIDQENSIVYQYSCFSEKSKYVSSKDILEIFGTKYLEISKKEIEELYYCDTNDKVIAVRMW